MGRVISQETIAVMQLQIEEGSNQLTMLNQEQKSGREIFRWSDEQDIETNWQQVKEHDRKK